MGVLCVAFFLEGLFASRLKSPSNDESVHMMAGRSYIATGKIIANPQHPPLLKELAGISLALAGIPWSDPAQASMERQPAGWEWAAGIKFVAESGISRTLFWARLPILVLSSLMGVLIYLGGRELAGPIAGFAALFLFAADPTMLAHSYLVTTDAGVTVFSLLFLLALLRFLRQPSLFRLAAAGVALGLALSGKFSAIFLLPIAGALLVANWLWPLAIREEPGRPPLVILLSDMAFLCLAAILVIQICYFSWRGPVLYLHGLGRVNADHTASFRAYLGGQLKERFLSYFAMAWLLKEPLATIALATGGAIAALRSRTIPRLHKLFLLFRRWCFSSRARYGPTIWVSATRCRLWYSGTWPGGSRWRRCGSAALSGELSRREVACGWRPRRRGFTPITFRISTRRLVCLDTSIALGSTAEAAAARTGWRTATSTGAKASRNSSHGWTGTLPDGPSGWSTSAPFRRRLMAFLSSRPTHTWCRFHRQVSM